MKSKALDRLIEFAQHRYGTAWNGHGVDDLVRKAYALGRKERGKRVFSGWSLVMDDGSPLAFLDGVKVFFSMPNAGTYYAGAKAVKVEVVQCPTSTSKR